MTIKELEALHELAAKLYAEELKKTGISHIPFAWTKHINGQIVVVAAFKRDADKLFKILACAERKDAELAALRGFALSLAKVTQTTGSGGLVYSSSIYERYRKFNLIDDNGNPTKLLTGESE